MPRITVEIAASADLDVVMGIWSAANATRKRPAGPLRTARVREKLEHGELVLLARYGERPAGMALAETFADGSSTDPDIGHVSMVFVEPALWGSGIGTKLLRDLQSRWPRLSAWIRTDNPRLWRLYLAVGFTDTGNRSQLQDGEEIMQLAWDRFPRADPN